MKMRNFGLAASVFAITLLLSVETLACACCVERGFRNTSSVKLNKFYMDLFRDIRFGQKAELYTDASGFESIRGLPQVEREYPLSPTVEFGLAGGFAERAWTFTVVTEKGSKGTLTLPMPTSVGRFMADIFDSPPESVSLYKEFIFNGTVRRGTGIFSSADRNGTRYSLVFQGRGNGCEEASAYKHWRLRISGPGSEFSLFGSLAE